VVSTVEDMILFHWAKTAVLSVKPKINDWRMEGQNIQMLAQIFVLIMNDCCFLTESKTD
jgi:hypothetical protein